MNRRISPTLLLLVPLLISINGCSDDGTTNAPQPKAVNDDIVIVPLFVQDSEGDPIDPASADSETLLSESRAGMPVLAPDGHHITWGEFKKPHGSVRAECVEGGSRATVDLSGLIPDGVYTLWNLTFRDPGFDPTLANIIGVGAAGTPDGTRNVFRASATGNGSLTVMTAAGPLSVTGSIAACPLTDEFEWHVVGLYHIDGESHGAELGPDGTMVEQFGFMFVR